MALARNLADLPTPSARHEDGRAPDPAPTFLAPYFDHLRDRNDAEGERPHAIAGTRFRHSNAAACARAVAYAALGVPASNPMDLAGIVVTSNGTTKHDEIQAVLERHGVDVEVGCGIDGFDGSGNADGLATTTDEGDDLYEGLSRRDLSVCWEHKNVGGFAFKMAVGERGAAQGPKHAHIVQGALNALALDADLLVITYMTWEAISVAIAQRKGFTEEGRVAAQWTFTREEWEPIARAEVARIESILALLDDGTLPARKIPDPEMPAGAVITDPTSGQWRVVVNDQILDAGSYWACLYCRWQDTCAQTPAGRTPIGDVAVVLGRKAAA